MTDETFTYQTNLEPVTADVQRESARRLAYDVYLTLPDAATSALTYEEEQAVQARIAEAIADAEKRAAARALRGLADDVSRCEDAATDAALEGLDYTLRTLRDRADALDPT